MLPELFQENSKAVSIDGYEDVPASNEKALQKAVAHQPVSVAIEASGRAFQFYTSVHDLCFCFFFFLKSVQFRFYHYYFYHYLIFRGDIFFLGHIYW